MTEIKIIARLDNVRKCILVDADGSADIKFTTDATQLAPVLQTLAEFKDRAIEITLKPLKEDLTNAGSGKGTQVIR
jgi:hypothetical protein